MIAKFFFQTKKRNQLLKNMMNGILCFIFSVAFRAVPLARGQVPRAGGSTGPKGGLVLWGCQVGGSGFPLSHRKHLFPLSHAHPSYLAVTRCVFGACYW